MKNLVVILIIAAALAFGAMNYHIILSDNGLKALKKTELTFDDTFVDARGDKKARLFLKPALLKAGIRDLLKEAGDSIK